jgi:cell division protein FtsW
VTTADLPLRRHAGSSRLRRYLPVLARFDSPVATYYLLLGATLLLLVIGLVRVLSASAVTSLKASGSSFTVFRSQMVFALIGLPLMTLAARLPVRAWRRIGWMALLVTLVAQLFVFTPLGVSVNGNRNWVGVG